MSEPPGLLVVAASGRALATSARNAGYAPIVVDFFADDDTCDCAEFCVRLQDGLQHGFQLAPLMAACAEGVGSRSIAGVVYGSGFEDRPALLAAVAERWRLFGNPADVVARVKDPLGFAALCQELDIPHPRTTLEPPAESCHWLARQRGGSGGGHIRTATGAPATDPQTYYQMRVEGHPTSALALASGGRAAVLGFSEQWSATRQQRPFRFAGAARPAAVPIAVERRLASAIDRFCAAIPLVGLNSFDFLVADHGFWLLEINPRPGATLDIFESENVGSESLVARHIAACEGVVAMPTRLEGAAAAEILFVDHEIARSPRIAWPEWARDRQPEGSHVAEGDPFCTIVASGVTIADARHQLSQRLAQIQSSISQHLAGASNSRESHEP